MLLCFSFKSQDLEREKIANRLRVDFVRLEIRNVSFEAFYAMVLQTSAALRVFRDLKL